MMITSGPLQFKQKLYEKVIIPHIQELALDKFASNVAEKAVLNCEENQLLPMWNAIATSEIILI